jgi:hypothetical protein
MMMMMMMTTMTWILIAVLLESRQALSFVSFNLPTGRDVGNNNDNNSVITIITKRRDDRNFLSDIRGDFKSSSSLSSQKLLNIIDERLRELMYERSSSKYGVVEQPNQMSRTESRIIADIMTREIRNDIENLEVTHKDESRRLEINLRKRITELENSISSNDERIKDAIADEAGHLRLQFREELALARAHFDGQIEII